MFVGGEDSGNLTGMGRQPSGLLVSPFVRRRLKLLASKERAADYERLTALIEAGQVTPTLDRTYALENAREAMQRLETGEVRGKIAIIV